ncbi:MAG TPA: SGNH/GDSL hydrolase family protein, partial [Acetobacteraceae bacterium]
MSIRPAAILAAMVLAAGAAFAPPARSVPYDAVYAFGDSLTDTGNTLRVTSAGLIPGMSAQPLPPYYQGRSSNGPVWIEPFTASLGLGPIGPSLAGGTDFAYAAGQTGATPLHPAATPLDLTGPTGQLAQFRRAVPTPSPNALYVLWIGSNDLYNIFYARGAGASPDPIAQANAAASNAANFVRAIAAGGARNLLFVTVPNLGESPEITKIYPAYVQDASDIARYYNETLLRDITQTAAASAMNL